MSKTLTAAERATLLRFASSLPVESETRRAIVAAVGKTSALNANVLIKMGLKGFTLHFQTQLHPLGLSTEQMPKVGLQVRGDAQKFVARLAEHLQLPLVIEREWPLVLLGVEGGSITFNLEDEVVNKSRKKLTREMIESAQQAVFSRFGYKVEFFG